MASKSTTRITLAVVAATSLVLAGCTAGAGGGGGG